MSKHKIGLYLEDYDNSQSTMKRDLLKMQSENMRLRNNILNKDSELTILKNKLGNKFNILHDYGKVERALTNEKIQIIKNPLYSTDSSFYGSVKLNNNDKQIHNFTKINDKNLFILNTDKNQDKKLFIPKSTSQTFYKLKTHKKNQSFTNSFVHHEHADSFDQNDERTSYQRLPQIPKSYNFNTEQNKDDQISNKKLQKIIEITSNSVFGKKHKETNKIRKINSSKLMISHNNISKHTNHEQSLIKKDDEIIWEEEQGNEEKETIYIDSNKQIINLHNENESLKNQIQNLKVELNSALVKINILNEKYLEKVNKIHNIKSEARKQKESYFRNYEQLKNQINKIKDLINNNIKIVDNKNENKCQSNSKSLLF